MRAHTCTLLCLCTHTAQKYSIKIVSPVKFLLIGEDHSMEKIVTIIIYIGKLRLVPVDKCAACIWYMKNILQQHICVDTENCT